MLEIGQRKFSMENLSALSAVPAWPAECMCVYYYGDDSVIVQQELRAISIRHQRAATHIYRVLVACTYMHTLLLRLPSLISPRCRLLTITGANLERRMGAQINLGGWGLASWQGCWPTDGKQTLSMRKIKLGHQGLFFSCELLQSTALLLYTHQTNFISIASEQIFAFKVSFYIELW